MPETLNPPSDGVTLDHVRVRYAETDMMGHAYYGSYLPWLEQARGAWCRDRGFTYLELEQKGWKLPVIEVWVRYRGEIKYDDLVEVRIWLQEVRRASLKFCYQLVRDGVVVTEAMTLHVVVGDSMKSKAIPQEMKDMLDRPQASPE